jgi:MFS family permease
MPLFGRVADVAGRRRLLMAGVARFALLADVRTEPPPPAMLLTGRAIQGVAAAIMSPNASDHASGSDHPDPPGSVALRDAALADLAAAATRSGG